MAQFFGACFDGLLNFGTFMVYLYCFVFFDTSDWCHSIFFKYWSRDLLISTLKDKSIRRVHLSENGSKVLYDERIYIGERIRDIEPLDSGFILSTDNGSLIYISPSTIIMGGGLFPPIE